jgi:hypothetical protein
MVIDDGLRDAPVIMQQNRLSLILAIARFQGAALQLYFALKMLYIFLALRLLAITASSTR